MVAQKQVDVVVVVVSEVELASRLGVLSLLHTRIGTVNVAKTIRFGGKQVGEWVSELRLAVKLGKQPQAVNKFILRTDFSLDASEDLTPREYSILMEEVENWPVKDEPELSNGDMELLTKNTPLEVEDFLKHSEMIRLDRARFAEVILRLLSIRSMRGNLHLPRKCMLDGWDAGKCLDDLRAKKASNKLEKWKIVALNNLDMIWTNSYPTH